MSSRNFEGNDKLQPGASAGSTQKTHLQEFCHEINELLSIIEIRPVFTVINACNHSGEETFALYFSPKSTRGRAINANLQARKCRNAAQYINTLKELIL